MDVIVFYFVDLGCQQQEKNLKTFSIISSGIKLSHYLYIYLKECLYFLPLIVISSDY